MNCFSGNEGFYILFRQDNLNSIFIHSGHFAKMQINNNLAGLGGDMAGQVSLVPSMVQGEEQYCLLYFGQAMLTSFSSDCGFCVWVPMWQGSSWG